MGVLFMSSDKRTLDYYNSKAKDFVSGTVDVAFTEIQDIFLEYIPEGGKILDFGCGSGRDMLRHYFAQSRLDAGWKLPMIANALEHKDTRTTELYLRIPENERLVASKEYFEM